MLVYLTTDFYHQPGAVGASAGVCCLGSCRPRPRRPRSDRRLPGLGPPVVTAGQGLALIRIPKLGLDAVMVEGTDPAALRKGPGHYPGSPAPCARGNVAIAGHRTTYGKAFSGLDLLTSGDQITLVTPQQRCTYQVVAGASPRRAPHKGSAAWITSPRDWTAVAPLQGSYLTLTTCHPKGSAAQRLIVRARLMTVTAA